MHLHSKWGSKVLHKVASFVWTTTLDNLVKRKMAVVNEGIMCKCSCETIEHLLIVL